MFTRLRTAIRTLTTKTQLRGDRPNIVFVEAPQKQKPSKASHAISVILSVAIITIVSAWVGRLLGHGLQEHTTTSVGTIVGIITAIMMMVYNWLLQAIHEKLNSTISTWIAPVFGHKITEAWRILKT
jgi:energy-converting hydrogenase Eha subunit A